MQQMHAALIEAAQSSPSHQFHAGPGYYALWVVGTIIVLTVVYFGGRTAVRSARRRAS
jgi:hypothetical protein